MTTLLRVDASIRVEGSVSRALADSAQAAWQAEHPNGTIVRRDLGLNPIPADTWPLAAAATMGMLTEDQLGPEHDAATAVARELSDELRAADAVILAVAHEASGRVMVKAGDAEDVHRYDIRCMPARSRGTAGRARQWLPGRPKLEGSRPLPRRRVTTLVGPTTRK